jgi:hypothetical protein
MHGIIQHKLRNAVLRCTFTHSCIFHFVQSHRPVAQVHASIHARSSINMRTYMHSYSTHNTLTHLQCNIHPLAPLIRLPSYSCTQNIQPTHQAPCGYFRHSRHPTIHGGYQPPPTQHTNPPAGTLTPHSSSHLPRLS